MSRLPPFQALLDAHRGEVHAFLVAAVGPHEADDCFQETFLSALRAYPRLDHARNLRSWVLTIAHRKALDSHRARRRRPLPVAEVPDAAASANHGGPELWLAVGALPAKQRAAVAHRFVCGLSYREIGRIVGCSEGAARQNVHEGLNTMRKELSR
jgi:RNA polymerase sigma factor (sigma-70 family)